MLFPHHIWRAIKQGEVKLAFRKWKLSRVKPGRMIRSAFGVIMVDEIKEIHLEEITQEDAHMAGYEHLQILIDALYAIPEGLIYKIQLHYHSEDDRISLSADAQLSDADYQKIDASLKKFDKHSNRGDWTMNVLHLIKKHPHTKASELADMLEMEKDWLKINIRKLKNLGLTISHDVGYSISPRGKAFLEKKRQ